MLHRRSLLGAVVFRDVFLWRSRFVAMSLTAEAHCCLGWLLHADYLQHDSLNGERWMPGSLVLRRVGSIGAARDVEGFQKGSSASHQVRRNIDIDVARKNGRVSRSRCRDDLGPSQLVSATICEPRGHMHNDFPGCISNENKFSFPRVQFPIVKPMLHTFHTISVCAHIFSHSDQSRQAPLTQSNQDKEIA